VFSLAFHYLACFRTPTYTVLEIVLVPKFKPLMRIGLGAISHSACSHSGLVPP
jgi:hypothetical protein